MKKTIVAICCIAFMLSFSSAVFAAESNNGGAGGTLTIDLSAGNVGGTTTDFTFASSPKVGISVFTSDNAYAITTANSLTDTSNGLEYGTLSTATGYALRTKTTDRDAGPATTTAVDALPGANWAWQGGGSSS